MVILGGWYLRGERGLVKDLKQAFAWNLKAADLGSALGLNNVGVMYMQGLGVSIRIHGNSKYPHFSCCFDDSASNFATISN